MSVKAAEDPKEVLDALWPRLQTLAVEPVRDEADFVERRAFQDTAFLAQWASNRLVTTAGPPDSDRPHRASSAHRRRVRALGAHLPGVGRGEQVAIEMASNYRAAILDAEAGNQFADTVQA